MADDTQGYDITEIRKLLLAAFTAEKLKRFCQVRPNFAPVLDDLGVNAGLNQIADQLITHCEKRVLFDELLDEVKKANLPQYERFAPRIGVSVPTADPETKPPHEQDQPIPDEIKSNWRWTSLVLAALAIVGAITWFVLERELEALLLFFAGIGGIISFIRKPSPPLDKVVAVILAIVFVGGLVYAFLGGAPDSIPPTDVAETADTPAPTPTGGRIAYTSHSGPAGNRDIYVMNADDTAQTRLTESTAEDEDPSWSPDGKKIVFTSARNENQQLYILDADTRAVDHVLHSTANDRFPCWSPDGERIAFVSDRDGDEEIYVLDVASGEVTPLTRNEHGDSRPSWSPDSKHITFNSDRSGNWEVWVMADDGTELRNITNHEKDDWEPCWSPDGTRIAFTSSRNDNTEIYTMDADGSGLVNVTNSPGSSDWLPCWSPDGKHIAFVSDRDGNAEIYVMNANGTGIKRLTNNGGEDIYPAWSP